MSNFATSTRKKYRYQTGRGFITTEDLWDLSLDDLDTLAKALNKQVKESGEESFVKKRSTVNKQLEIQLEVVKEVIQFKLDAIEAQKTKADKAAKRNQLLEALNKKENEAVDNLSMKQLKAQLDKLEEEEEEF